MVSKEIVVRRFQICSIKKNIYRFRKMHMLRCIWHVQFIALQEFYWVFWSLNCILRTFTFTNTYQRWRFMGLEMDKLKRPILNKYLLNKYQTEIVWLRGFEQHRLCVIWPDINFLYTDQCILTLYLIQNISVVFSSKFDFLKKGKLIFKTNMHVNSDLWFWKAMSFILEELNRRATFGQT